MLQADPVADHAAGPAAEAIEDLLLIEAEDPRYTVQGAPQEGQHLLLLEGVRRVQDLLGERRRALCTKKQWPIERTNDQEPGAEGYLCGGVDEIWGLLL